MCVQSVRVQIKDFTYITGSSAHQHHSKHDERNCKHQPTHGFS